MRARNAVLGSAIAVGILVLLAVLYPAEMGTVAFLAFFLIVVIGMHELGHFIFAKRAGMKVTEFFIGFGPRLWSVQRGETEYGIKALPLGGYCKIIGMTNLEQTAPEDEDRTFRSKSFWAKTTTLLAGPASHFVLAFILIWAVTAFEGDILVESHQRVTTAIGIVEKGSPADKAGIKPGDRIVSFNEMPVKDWEDVSKRIHKAGGQRVAIVINRGDRQPTLYATTAKKNPSGIARGYLGVTPRIEFDKPSVMGSIVKTPGITWDLTKQTAAGFGHMFSPAGVVDYVANFTNDENSTKPADVAKQQDAEKARFVSLVGVGRAAHSAVEAGWVNVFFLMILINLSVGMINLLPLIPFDGGHIAIAGYEAVMSKIYRRKYRADFAKLMPIALVTVGIFAFIFLSSMFLDITKPA